MILQSFVGPLLMITLAASALHTGQVDTARKQTSPNSAGSNQQALRSQFVGPVLLSTPRRYLPEASRREKISGAVQVVCWISAEGTTSHISVVKGLRPDLDQIAMDEVSQYRFQPATLAGKTIPISGFHIDVHFE